MDVLIERFSDDTGFNYIAFLEVLQPSEKTDYKYTQRLKELNLVNKKSLLSTGSTDISEIMNKIKTKVVKERVRVEEFMKDYDKLRTGRLLKSVFPRAIDLCNFNLVKPEVDELMKWWVFHLYVMYFGLNNNTITSIIHNIPYFYIGEFYFDTFLSYK